MKLILFCLYTLLLATALLPTATFAAEPVVFQARTVKSGSWSDAEIWEGQRQPKAGDFVQVRAGHVAVYDAHSDAALRMVHVAGTLAFSREKSTLLVVGLLKVEAGETTTEDGFDCHDAPAGAHASHAPAVPTQPALEVGTRQSPVPAGVMATIRLRHFPGTNEETLPAIVSCGGRWDVHGAPLNRTWLKLAAPAKAGDRRVTLEEPPSGWGVGDRIIITTGELRGPESGATFRQSGGKPKSVGTEERLIAACDGAVITLDSPLSEAHRSQPHMRCEVANLSRNVVIESADPRGVRGHTMYHHGSAGGISYAEFRHLGKEGVLGKYAIHFHLVRDTMRGSGVTGASIWDSHNRWITIHGTDHLLIRDCVGYQSRGHGFFLEDATEQWNVLDRNLAVQAFTNAPLPKQVLPYDPNDGAGFWWANGQNTFTRNVSCENDRYGFHFHIAKTPDFNPVLGMRAADGRIAERDVRSVPFYRFEDNESHGEGLFSFRFGDEAQGAVHGDREHPFVVRNLRVWQAHYAIRPNVQFFLLDGLRVTNAAYGIYHPDYDAHVYRDVTLQNVTGEPLNGGHDDASLPYGDFSYDRLTFENCQLSREALIQLTGIGPKPGLVGHFRGVTLSNSQSSGGSVVDFGGGPRTNKVDHPVSYYFHDSPGSVTRVASVKTPAVLQGADYRSIDGWTGPEARAMRTKGIPFPELLSPLDDLPPATLITRIEHAGVKRLVRGVSHDNGEITTVQVNGQPAVISARSAGVVDWTISLALPIDSKITAFATDDTGNTEQTPHQVSFDSVSAR